MRPMPLLLVFCSSLTLSLAANERYHEDFHYSYAQTAGGRFSIENFNGSIELTGWDQNTVEINGTKYADTEERLRAIRIDISNTGNSVQIRTVRPYERHGNMGAKYVIKVPRQTEIERVHSSNGSLRVENIDGNLTLETSNGSVHLSGIHGSMDAHTSNGGIEASKVDGRINFHTSNGSVHAQNVRGGVNATTSNGSVELELAAPHTNDVIASTSNGDITVRLPGDTNATVSAHTSGHDRIYSDFGVTMHGELAKYHMEGTIGSGGPRLDLKTSNGSIRLLKI